MGNQKKCPQAAVTARAGENLEHPNDTPRPRAKQGRKRRRAWAVKKLHAECRAAPAVWLALCELAAERGSSLLTPTREQICKIAGISRPRTISTALRALADAGWIDVHRVRVSGKNGGFATLMKVVLFYEGQKMTPIGARSMGVRIRPLRAV